MRPRCLFRAVSAKLARSGNVLLRRGIVLDAA
jgi:hypothetical protein